MPIQPRTWNPNDIVSATYLDGDLYEYQGQLFTPNGARFRARPMLYKGIQGSTVTIPGSTFLTVFPAPQGSSPLIDTGADYGAQLDGQYTGYLIDLLDGSAGVPGGPPSQGAGWYLVSAFAPVQSSSSSPYALAVRADPTGNILSMGTQISGNSAHDVTPFVIDLLQFPGGGTRFYPSVFNGASGSASLRASGDGSGECTRWQAQWASVPAGTVATTNNPPAPKASWAATDTVTAELLNQNQGIRNPLRVFMQPPALKAVSLSPTSCPASAAQQISIAPTSAAGLDSYSGMSGSSYTVPFPGCWLCFGQVTWPASAQQAKCGISVNGTTYWGPATPTPTYGSGETTATKLQIFDLEAGDTVSLAGLQTSSGSVNTEMDNPPRLIMLWLGNLGAPTPLPAVPNLGFRYSAGDNGLSDLTNLANDLNFLAYKPCLLSCQTVAQSVPQSTDTFLNLDTPQGLIHGSAGDNYNGYSVSSAQFGYPVSYYTAQQPGWYMAVGEVFFPAATLSASPAILAEIAVNPNSYAASPSDWYGHCNSTSGGNPAGGTAFGYYALREGDQIYFGCQAQDTASGNVHTSVATTATSHFEVVWVSAL